MPIEGLRLDPATNVEIRGKSYSLDWICNSLRNYNLKELHELFDTAGQLAIGRHLFAETLGKVDAVGRGWLREQDEVQEIRVISQSSSLRRLPWNLLAREHSFLAANRWAFSMATSRTPGVVARPALRPKVLIAFPEPKADYGPTAGDAHFAALRELLRVAVSERYALERIFPCRTWEETREKLVTIAPDIFYFYGHGESYHEQPRLIFEDSDGRAAALPMLDFAQFLAALDHPPWLVYLNCCSGDANGGLLDAGRQLHETIPAVFANRTEIPVDVAQVLGREVLRALLVDGMAPHTALAQCLMRAPELGLTFDDPGWMTSALHARYDVWDFPGLGREENPALLQDRDDIVPARRALGRAGLYQQIHSTVAAMLGGDLPPWRIFCWSAPPGQGCELFHDDVAVVLENCPGLDHLKSWRFVWPPWMRDPTDDTKPDLASLRLALCDSFDVESIDEIPAQLAREQRDWQSGATRLHYLRLPPIPIPRQPIPLPRPIDSLAFVLRTLYQKIAPTVCPPAYLVVGVPLLTPQAGLTEELGKNLAQLPAYDKIWRSLPALAAVEVSALEKALEGQVLDDIRGDFARHLWQRTAGSYEELVRLLPQADELSEEFRFEKMLAG